jgi:hypothetical protein
MVLAAILATVVGMLLIFAAGAVVQEVMVKRAALAEVKRGLGS